MVLQVEQHICHSVGQVALRLAGLKVNMLSLLKFPRFPFSVDPWWRHQMETFSALLAICVGIHRWPVNSPQKGKWRGAFMFSLICGRINRWVNNREADDLRRYRAHYDIIVMHYASAFSVVRSSVRISVREVYGIMLKTYVTGLPQLLKNHWI